MERDADQLPVAVGYGFVEWRPHLEVADFDAGAVGCEEADEVEVAQHAR